MMGIEWIRRVLGGWRLPERMVRGVLALVANRWVKSSLTARAWHLRRSIGMGGTASPLIWNLCYDPIVWAVAACTGVPAPTFVDDLAALVRGPQASPGRATISSCCCSLRGPAHSVALLPGHPGPS